MVSEKLSFVIARAKEKVESYSYRARKSTLASGCGEWIDEKKIFFYIILK